MPITISKNGPEVECRPNSRADDWHPAPGMNPAEVAELNQIMGWVKYRVIAQQSLEDRITAVLEAADFVAWTRTTPSNQPAFIIAEGVGATVSLHWQASTGQRERVLVNYANALRVDGLNVVDRGNHLYVAEPQS